MQTIADFILCALEDKYLGKTILSIYEKEMAVKEIEIDNDLTDGCYIIFRSKDDSQLDCRHITGKMPRIVW